MSNKEKYRIFCEQRQSDVPLFLQYWWMETVCHGKQWDVALAWDGDNLLGALPFHFVTKLGMTFILQPQLTQFSGPYYCYPDGIDEMTRLDFEKDVARKLLSQIEAKKPSVFIQRFSPTVTNWLPFYWAGYEQTTRYTYRLLDISDPQKLFSKFIHNKRQKKIRHYEKCTAIHFDMEPADFAEFHHKYWNSKGKHDLLPKDFIVRVCTESLNQGHGVIASLHDSEGRLLVARFVVYDNQCAHSLMSAYNTTLHHSGHSETLIWGLLKHLSDKTKVFDFEGSMDEGIEYFYRSFGATQTPFFEVSKYRNILSRLIIKLKSR